VWLEKKTVTLAELGSAISNRCLLNTNLPVYISGDQDTKHGAMLDVLQTVRRAGVQTVAFLVDGPPEAAAP
jgi:biopolymer transport protein ExbD